MCSSQFLGNGYSYSCETSPHCLVVAAVYFVKFLGDSIAKRRSYVAPQTAKSALGGLKHTMIGRWRARHNVPVMLGSGTHQNIDTKRPLPAPPPAPSSSYHQSPWQIIYRITSNTSNCNGQFWVQFGVWFGSWSKESTYIDCMRHIIDDYARTSHHITVGFSVRQDSLQLHTSLKMEHLCLT